jgi:hypothetical protein
MNLDKLMLNNENLSINKFNCYKVFFASLLVTNKLYDDFVIPKSILCKVALIDSSELISLEAEFLQKVSYNIYIEEAEFFKYKLKLQSLHDKIKKEIEKQKEEKEISEKQLKENNNGLQSFKWKCCHFNYDNSDNDNEYLDNNKTFGSCNLEY